jgi:hypothetical protein
MVHRVLVSANSESIPMKLPSISMFKTRKKRKKKRKEKIKEQKNRRKEEKKKEKGGEKKEGKKNYHKNPPWATSCTIAVKLRLPAIW